MLISFTRGETSVILRVKIRNSSLTTGAGLTGLTSGSSGLKISTIADNEATATTYTVAGSTIETITTLGTFATPTATKCRFKEVDSTNHPGVYEIQLDNSRFSVSNAKSLLISISGATNAAECDALIPLTGINPYDSVRAGLTGLANATPGAAGGLLIAGTNSGATSFTGGMAISSNSTYGLEITSSANSRAAIRARASGSASHGILIEAIGASTSHGIVISGSDKGIDIEAGGSSGAITVQAGYNGNALLLLGGDGDSDVPVVKIDTFIVTGTCISLSNTAGGISTGVKVSTGGTAVNLENGSDQSTVRIVSVGTDCAAIDIASSTNYGSINVSSSAGAGIQVLASGGNAVDLTALSNGHGLSLTKNGASYNDLNLTNNDSGTWPTVQGYASGQAPLQPTVAGRTVNISASGYADADIKAIAGNTTAATNQANAAAVVYSGTITSSPTTTTFRDSGLTQTDSNHWNGRVIIFLSGTLKYEGTKITGFDPSTDQLTFDALTSAPIVGNTYIIV